MDKLIAVLLFIVLACICALGMVLIWPFRRWLESDQEISGRNAADPLRASASPR